MEVVHARCAGDGEAPRRARTHPGAHCGSRVGHTAFVTNTRGAAATRVVCRTVKGSPYVLSNRARSVVRTGERVRPCFTPNG